jgi:hypothetical protein
LQDEQQGVAGYRFTPALGGKSTIGQRAAGLVSAWILTTSSRNRKAKLGCLIHPERNFGRTWRTHAEVEVGFIEFFIILWVPQFFFRDLARCEIGAKIFCQGIGDICRIRAPNTLWKASASGIDDASLCGVNYRFSSV